MVDEEQHISRGDLQSVFLLQLVQQIYQLIRGSGLTCVFGGLDWNVVTDYLSYFGLGREVIQVFGGKGLGEDYLNELELVDEGHFLLEGVD